MAAAAPAAQAPAQAALRDPRAALAESSPAGATASQQQQSPPQVLPVTARGDDTRALNTATAAVPTTPETERRVTLAGSADAGNAVPLPGTNALNALTAYQATHAAAPAQARLSATPGSPDFAPQLGTQITTFVRDGVQHAQLHLNPVEMGPVSVQIQLDGQTAQVHLSADHALTRQALEASMPQLASQLSEAGLTLGGGGVFEQPRQDREAAPQASPGASDRSGRGDGGRSRGDSLPAPVQPPMRRGVVDLVA